MRSTDQPRRCKAPRETKVIQSVWFCKLFITNKMGWKQIIPLHSILLCFPNLFPFFPLICKQTAVPWVYLSSALSELSGGKAVFLKAFQNSCGITSHQRFSPLPATASYSRTLPNNLFLHSPPPTPPPPKLKPTVI